MNKLFPLYIATFFIILNDVAGRYTQSEYISDVIKTEIFILEKTLEVKINTENKKCNVSIN